MKTRANRFVLGILALGPLTTAAYAQQEQGPAPPQIDPSITTPSLPQAAPSSAVPTPTHPPAQTPALPPAPVKTTPKPKTKAKPASSPAKKSTAKAVPARPQPRITLDFRDAPIDDILNRFSVLSGLTVIKDSSLQGTATLVNARPIALSDAFSVLEALLDSRGFSLDRNSTLMRVLPKGQGGSGRGGFGGFSGGFAGRFGGGPGNGGGATGGNPGAVSGSNGGDSGDAGGGPGGGFAGFGGGRRGGDQTEVYRLQYASAKALASIVNDLFKNAAGGGQTNGNQNRGGNGGFRGGGFPGGGFRGGPGGFPGGFNPGNNQNNNNGATGNNAAAASAPARASSDDYSNSLIVTGPANQLAQIRSVVEQIDRPMGSTQLTQVFQLRYIDATEMAAVASNVLLASQTGGAGSGTASQMPFEQRAFMNARGGSSAASNGQVVASTETNSLVCTASSESLDLLAQVIKELDKPQKTESTTFVRNLKNVSATDVAQLLSQIYGNRQGVNSNNPFGNTSTGRNGASRFNTNRNNNTSPFGNNGRSGGGGGFGGGGFGGGGFGGGGFGG